MSNVYIRHSIRFILLLLAQVLIVNELELNKFIHPQVYLLFLLLLPTNLTPTASLLIGFGTGIVLDTFSNTMGIHTAAATLMMYARYFILASSVERKDDDPAHELTVKRVGRRFYFTHLATMVAIHHTLLFFLSAFNMSAFFSTMGTIIMSGTFTIILMVLIQSTFYKAAERR